MNDYKEILKTLLLRYYSPHPIGAVEKQYKTTSQVLAMAQGIIPTEPIDQHDIYDVLQELGFTIELVTMPDDTLVYCWCLYKKALLLQGFFLSFHFFYIHPTFASLMSR